MEFGKLTVDAPIDTGALRGAILGADSRQTRFLAQQTFLNEGPPRTSK